MSEPTMAQIRAELLDLDAEQIIACIDRLQENWHKHWNIRRALDKKLQTVSVIEVSVHDVVEDICHVRDVDVGDKRINWDACYKKALEVSEYDWSHVYDSIWGEMNDQLREVLQESIPELLDDEVADEDLTPIGNNPATPT